jgi:hypothetical protein
MRNFKCLVQFACYEVWLGHILAELLRRSPSHELLPRLLAHVARLLGFSGPKSLVNTFSTRKMRTMRCWSRTKLSGQMQMHVRCDVTSYISMNLIDL